jgi:penicillin V acylase-like amidase (Ntn superfamily)
MIMLLLMLMSWAAATHACSNFLLEGGGDFVVSARTMDLGPGLSFGVATVPAGSKLSGGGTEPTRESKALLGFVGFVPVEAGLVLEHFVTAGMNTAGLSCDQQTLLGSVYPNKTGNATTDVAIDHFCERVLARFNGTAQLAAALAERRLTPHGPSVAGGQHFVVRDARGESLVVEFTDGTASVFVDHNDGGESGFGILTNEPNFQWHVENVRHARWKMRNARPSFTLPGAYYPDERFLRIDLLKRGMPKPTAMREAIQQAVHVLNSVTVPAGAQMGTDSSRGEGQGDHTMFGVVYDHTEMAVFWRTEANQNLQRIRLADAKLEPGAARGSLAFGVGKNDLPYFHDAALAIIRK